MTCTKQLVLAFFLLSIISCKVRKNEKEFFAPSNKEINEVIKQVIVQDSLDTQIPIFINLLDVIIWSQKNDSLPHPPLEGLISLNTITYPKEHKILFSVSDSSFLKSQAKNQLKLKIDTSYFNRQRFISSLIDPDYKLKDPYYKYYRFSKPIFCLRKDKALVLLDKMCPDCGSGRLYFLSKENNKWVITLNKSTWRN